MEKTAIVSKEGLEMWLFTKHGFFSAVKNYNNGDYIHVRARFKGDLDRLCEAYNLVPNVVKTPKGDYPYRMDFPREIWAFIVKREAESIDYTDFEVAVRDGSKRYRAYLEAWTVLHKYQD